MVATSHRIPFFEGRRAQLASTAEEGATHLGRLHVELALLRYLDPEELQIKLPKYLWLGSD
ncbi:hypothetical protein E2562_007107 [Oryza meyeriana var. granulata]|uniref:Uncharacterized protein n=1 Tax=Oryza meyeriana var. granulata TaxID=110450 RepID=A0A6G1F4U4_9ORYZ|nr:hypothetical protein E2562_007107 [Oryza meyeriana var. granulata]